MMKYKCYFKNHTLLYSSLTIVFLGFYLLGRYGLVQHLLFILWPVVFIVENALNLPFDYEIGVGFVNKSANIIIDQSCAGTTFWTMAFCMLGFSFIPRAKGIWKKATWFFAFFLFAYIITLFANVSRIIIAVGILNLKISENASTERLLHQSAGVLVYCTYLWITYLIFSNLIRKEENNEKSL